jgi:hypothetical protein
VPGLPLTFLATAAAAFAAAAVAAPWATSALAGHYYHPALFALTHTLTLGWITLSIVGASCQIVPAVLGRPLWSARLEWVAYAALLVGAAGIVAHFALAEFVGLVYSAALVGLGVLVHAGNVTAALARLRQWTFVTRCVALAVGGLVITVVAGSLLAFNHARPFLPAVFPAVHAHVHIALLGWVLPMVLGVAAHAYPTFLHAPEPRGRLADVQLGGLLLGVPGIALALLAWPAMLPPAATMVTVTVGAHLVWVGRTLRARRRGLDWPVRFVLTGTVALALSTALGLGFAFDLLAGPRAALAYGVLALGGWATFTIAGMMLKIVPYLVWSAVYASRVGLQPVPSIEALSWPAVERLAWALLTPGVAGLVLAVAAASEVWIFRATLLAAAGALAFAAAVAHALWPLLARAGATPLPLAGPGR